MPKTQGAFKEKTKTKVTEPKKYSVIMYNDDFTTMEFVVEILISIFRKDRAEAERLMLLVHRTGSAVVGQYSYDIAATKVNAALSRAKEAGYPFRVTMEET
ncbi:MAG: ATP-dependent Clp protease adaptor ClpS [Lachnospiraceae bacterium]|nr:ATP-dependent Clp protease adaptor ClpS [Lachnospiraceae bacterium]